MKLATNGSMRLAWDEAGQGSPVLLIMGHVFPSSMWHSVIPALSQHHRVVWFDNRGTGSSGSSRHATVSDLAADARTVLDAAGVEQAHVYGVSMGGGVAMQLAFETPERVSSLVLGCTGFKADDVGNVSAVRRLAYFVPLRFLRPVFRKGLYGPAVPEDAAQKDLDVLAAGKVSGRGLLGQVEAMRTYALTAESMAALTMPALVLHGDADTTVSLDRGRALAAALPDARLVVYPGAGHSFYVGIEDRANGDVLTFLAEVDRHASASA